MKLLIFSILLTSTLCRLSGFESNLEKVESSTNLVIELMHKNINPIIIYITNYDKFFKNEMLFSTHFLDDLNEMIVGFEEDKAMIFRNLKLMLNNIYFVASREKSFDLFLKEDYSNLIQFLANLDLEENLEELFKDFVGQKNMVFYDVKQIHENIKDLTTTILNYFNLFERLRKESKLEDDTSQKMSLIDLKRYYYILGVLKNFSIQKAIFDHLEEDFGKNIRNFQGSLENFDDSLDTLKIYYHKRYIEGIVEDDDAFHEEENLDDGSIAIDEIDHSSAEEGENDENGSEVHRNGSEDGSDLNEDEAKEEERDPINLCDTIMLDNYDINASSDAFELPKFDQIPECTNIQNSCCSKDEITRIFKKFDYSVLPIIEKKYRALYDMINYILENYTSFNKYAYDIFRLPNKDPMCELSSRNIIFTPISKDFVKKFKIFMKESFKFSLTSKNGIFCALCNYDFNKTMIEEGTIKLSEDFCNQMVKDTFDFTSAYNLQLIDYFNNLIKVLQCDPIYGEQRTETDLEFAENKYIIDLLVKCDEKDRENCNEYCSNFFFTKFTSVFDVDLELIFDFFKFLSSKIASLKIPTKKPINHDSLRIIFADLIIEKNQKGLQSIDSLKRVIIAEDEEDNTANNPFTDGTDVKTIESAFED